MKAGNGTDWFPEFARIWLAVMLEVPALLSANAGMAAIEPKIIANNKNPLGLFSND